MLSYYRFFVLLLTFLSLVIATPFSAAAQFAGYPDWPPMPVRPTRLDCGLQVSPSKAVYPRGEQVTVTATLLEVRWIRDPRNGYPRALVRRLKGATIFLYELSSSGSSTRKVLVGAGSTDADGRFSVKYTVPVDRRKQGLKLRAETSLLKVSEYPTINIPTSK